MEIPKPLYITGAIFMAGLLYLYADTDPLRYSFLPNCPFHTLFGLDCPGCGSQRAIYALLHGNIFQAIDYNMLLVFSLPLLVIYFFGQIIRLKNKPSRPDLLFRPLTLKIFGGVVAGFWIIRNIPGHPFSFLAA